MAAEGIMAARENSVKRYVVRLSADERERLEALIRKGKSPAQRLLKARILLKADVSEAGEGWRDSRIIKALETSVRCWRRRSGASSFFLRRLRHNTGPTYLFRSDRGASPCQLSPRLDTSVFNLSESC